MATDGFSKIKFIEGIRQADAVAENVVIVLDREQGAKAALKKIGVKLYSLITLREVLEYMKENNLVDMETYNEVMDYLEKNE